MKRYIKRILIISCMFAFFSACDDSDSTPENNEAVSISLGCPVLKTMENITPLQIPVVLTKPAPQDITVEIAVKSELGAKENIHFSFYSKKITLPKGSTAGFFEVRLTDDRETNPDRIFEVELVNATGARLSDLIDVCRVIIQSDEGYPTLGFEKALMSVDEDSKSLDVPITLGRPSAEPVTFSIEVLNKWDAVENTHFILPAEKQFTIPAGDTIYHLNIGIKDDDNINDNRVFEIALKDASLAVISEVFKSCKITILNDDRYPTLSFAVTDTSIYRNEGLSLKIPVKLNFAPKNPVTVEIGLTGHGTAKEGEHFEMTSHTLVFEKGETEKVVVITPTPYEKTDYDRTLGLRFLSVENAEKAVKDTVCNVLLINDIFNYQQLYENLMGEWTLTQTAKTNNVPTCKVIIYGGDTPAEEDENYLKYLKCKAVGYAEGRNDIVWRMSYNAETGEIKVICGEIVAKEIGFNVGSCDIKFEHNGSTDPVSTTHNKNYSEIKWDSAVTIGGILYKHDTGERINSQWFDMANVVLTKKK